jgi:hypothetical protein
MKQVTYTDKEGKRYEVLIPDGASNDEAVHGIVIGPPNLLLEGVPVDTRVALHNQLHSRGILTVGDAKRNRQELINALMATLKLDVERIMAEMEGTNGSSSHSQP